MVPFNEKSKKNFFLIVVCVHLHNKKTFHLKERVVEYVEQ